jgi:hypothetical protein
VKLAAVLERAGEFLLEPAAEGTPPAAAAPLPAAPSLEPISVAVMGLATGCGARTVAAGLALALGRGGDPAFLVCLGGAPPAARALRACEVPPALTEPEEVATYGGTLLRLSGAAQPTSVWSVPARQAPRAATVVAETDTVVAVAGPSSEPALAGMVCSLLAERCRRVLLVSNAASDPSGWAAWAAACVPESRIGAAVIGRGRLPGGRLGQAFAELAALTSGVAAGGLAPHHGLFTARRGG